MRRAPPNGRRIGRTGHDWTRAGLDPSEVADNEPRSHSRLAGNASPPGGPALAWIHARSRARRRHPRCREPTPARDRAESHGDRDGRSGRGRDPDRIARTARRCGAHVHRRRGPRRRAHSDGDRGASGR